MKRYLSIALSLAVFPVLTFMLGALNFLRIESRFRTISGTAAFLCLAASLCLAWKFKCLRVTACVLAAALAFGTLKLADAEWDGKTIHKPAAILLAKGWDPVHDDSVQEALQAGKSEADQLSAVWCVHYPKASWIVNASLYQMTGNIDIGDGVALVWMAVLFFAAAYAFEKLYGVQGHVLWALAGVAALNPIVVRELVCGYVDGLLALSLCTGILSFAVWIRTREWGALVLAGMACIYGANLKFTGLAYFGVAYAVLSVAAYVKLHREVREAKISCATDMTLFLVFIVFTVGLVFACGVSPYVLNVIRHGSPFYPLHSFNGAAPVLDVATQWFTPDAEKLGALGRFFYSHFPFSERLTDLQPYNRNDLCMKFSQFFRVALLLGVLGLAWKRKFDVVLLALVATIAVQPQGWHGRYIPQLWLLPVLAACLVPRLRWAVVALLLAALYPSTQECYEQLRIQALRCRALPNLDRIESAAVYSGTNAEGFEHEYDFYWNTFLADAGVKNYRRLEEIPADRNADFWIYDLRVYSDVPLEPRRENALAAILEFRARQFKRNLLSVWD